MKLFLDTADVDEISKAHKTGLLSGVTTNPTLMRKCGFEPMDVYQEIIDMGVPDVSMEVVGSADEMLEQALMLREKFGPACTIKVPCTWDGLKVCRDFKAHGYVSRTGKREDWFSEDYRVNVTLIFSASQAILAAQAHATYVSPFVGRWNDESVSGTAVVQTIADIYAQHKQKTKVLAASVREVYQVGRCFAAGADICTIPPHVFWGMMEHAKTREGLEQFQKDWDDVHGKNQ